MSRGRSLALCVASGACLSLAFPEPSLSPIAWLAIAPLLIVGERTSPSRGGVVGLAFGFGFFGALLVWVSAVGWIAWLLLVLKESLYLALFGALWGVVSRLERAWWLVAAPALWVTVEVLREYTPVVGFPWGQLAQGQVSLPWFLSAAGFGGGRTISFVVVALNVAAALVWLGRGWRRLAWIAVFVTIPSMVLLSFLMEPQYDTSVDPLRVAVIQGNASAGVEVDDQRSRVQRHLELTKTLAGEDVDLVVWPESSVGIDPLRDPQVREQVAAAARSVGAPMIVGANLDIDAQRYAVVALLVSEAGEIVDRYHKTHLVPFGEYIPARPALGWIPMLAQVPRDAVPGDEAKNFKVRDVEVGTVISFEGDFGPLVRERVDLGARVLVVATNTSTWGRSWASAQHVAMSQVRAAETGVPVIHAALSGISAAVTADGEVTQETPLYEEATLIFDVTPAPGVTFYSRSGEWLTLLCFLVAVGGLVFAWRRPAVSVSTR